MQKLQQWVPLVAAGDGDDGDGRGGRPPLLTTVDSARSRWPPTLLMLQTAADELKERSAEGSDGQAVSPRGRGRGANAPLPRASSGHPPSTRS